MRVIYMAHPLGGGRDRERNRANASRWVAWLAETFGVAVIADWIVLSGEWLETPENREKGLAFDMALVERADEVWLVGGRVSPGMAMEANKARLLCKPVVDLTSLGYEVPERARAWRQLIAAEVSELDTRIDQLSRTEMREGLARIVRDLEGKTEA